MMLARTLGMVAVAGLLGCQAGGQSETRQAELASQDLQFAQDAAMGGLKEVTLGGLAQQRAEDDQVVQFGQRMVQDHGQANERLMAIAEEKGIQLPQQLPQDVQQTYQELQQLSDAEFDRAYMDEMVTDHEEDVQAFERQAQSGQDPDLRAFAQETLPTLHEHLELAEQIRAQVTAAIGAGPEHNRAAAVGMADRAA
jgi:putative membrane protein